MSEVLKMPQKPDGLEEMIRNTIMPQDTDNMLEEADRLAREVRGILLAAQASISEPVDARNVFKGFYSFVFEYRNKVLSACERKDVLTAGFAAFQLQEEIC